MELKRYLEEPIVLAAYGAEVDDFDCGLFFYKETVYKAEGIHALHQNFIKLNSEHPLMQDILNGEGIVRARTNHGIQSFKTKKEDRLLQKQEVLLYPVSDFALEKEMRDLEITYIDHYNAITFSRLDKTETRERRVERVKNKVIDYREKQLYVEFSEDALHKKSGKDQYEILDLGFGKKNIVE